MPVQRRKPEELSLTHAELLATLRYDPLTGEFWRLKRPNKKRAGNLEPNGYRRVYVKGARYLEHRLAWFYVYGKWPKEYVDHIDHDPSNNRIENLREAAHTENIRYACKQRRNTSGYKGVSELKLWPGKYEVRFAFPGDNGRRTYLGTYRDPAEASAIYEALVRKYHGEFSYIEEEQKGRDARAKADAGVGSVHVASEEGHQAGSD